LQDDAFRLRRTASVGAIRGTRFVLEPFSNASIKIVKQPDSASQPGSLAASIERIGLLCYTDQLKFFFGFWQ